MTVVLALQAAFGFLAIFLLGSSVIRARTVKRIYRDDPVARSLGYAECAVISAIGAFCATIPTLLRIFT